MNIHAQERWLSAVHAQSPQTHNLTSLAGLIHVEDHPLGRLDCLPGSGSPNRPGKVLFPNDREALWALHIQTDCSGTLVNPIPPSSLGWVIWHALSTMSVVEQGWGVDCWERQSPVQSVLTHTWLHRKRPWVWNTSLSSDKSLHGLCWVYHFVWEYHSRFRLNVSSFVLLKCVHHMAPGQPHY